MKKFIILNTTHGLKIYINYLFIIEMHQEKTGTCIYIFSGVVYNVKEPIEEVIKLIEKAND